VRKRRVQGVRSVLQLRAGIVFTAATTAMLHAGACVLCTQTIALPQRNLKSQV
jgi:hypothetical protein